MQLAKTTTRNLLVVCIGLALTACGATLPRIPAQGQLHGQPIATTVDSPLAKYYLENYLAGRRERAEWDERFDRLHRQPDLRRPTTAQMQAISREYSVDVAAMFYALRLLEDPGNRELQSAFDRVRNDGATEVDRSYRVVFVPGWLYQSKPWTGADFAKPREVLTALGVEHHLVDLLDNGSVEENAILLRDALIPLLQDRKPVIIVSGSKGSPEVAMVLGQLMSAEQTAPVRAWLNICGALQGSPLANTWTAWPVAWATNLLFQLRGYGGLEGISSLRIERSRERARDLRIPEHIQVVNYVGVPVSGTILDTEFEKRFTYVQLRDHGPNDGLVLIADEIDQHGLTITEVGRGHFLSYEDFGQRATSALRTVMQRLSGAAADGDVRTAGTAAAQ